MLYTTRAGDTLLSVASNNTNSPMHALDIGRINGFITDTYVTPIEQPLEAGIVLFLPDSMFPAQSPIPLSVDIIGGSASRSIWIAIAIGTTVLFLLRK